MDAGTDPTAFPGPDPARDAGPLYDIYERTYAHTPAVAARRLQWARETLTQARHDGDTARANSCADQIAALEAVLTRHARCRRCGRELTHPDSVTRGVGPECHGREPS